MADKDLFGRNGTIGQMMNLASDISGFKNSGEDAVSRGGALARIVSMIMSFFA